MTAKGYVYEIPHQPCCTCMCTLSLCTCINGEQLMHRGLFSSFVVMCFVAVWLKPVDIVKVMCQLTTTTTCRYIALHLLVQPLRSRSLSLCFSLPYFLCLFRFQEPSTVNQRMQNKHSHNHYNINYFFNAFNNSFT